MGVSYLIFFFDQRDNKLRISDGQIDSHTQNVIFNLDEWYKFVIEYVDNSTTASFYVYDNNENLIASDINRTLIYPGTVAKIAFGVTGGDCEAYFDDVGYVINENEEIIENNLEKIRQGIIYIFQGLLNIFQVIFAFIFGEALIKIMLFIIVLLLFGIFLEILKPGILNSFNKKLKRKFLDGNKKLQKK